jgi:hypothetical protein
MYPGLTSFRVVAQQVDNSVTIGVAASKPQALGDPGTNIVFLQTRSFPGRNGGLHRQG